MNQNPFNLYDFLGYFIPGILFLALAQFSGFLSLSFFEPLRQDSEWIFISILIVVAYVSGHLLSIASSRTIEDYHTWMNGYPSEHIFSQNYKRKKAKRYTKLVMFLVFPIVIVDLVCRNLFGYKAKTMADSLSRIVLKKSRQFFSGVDEGAASEIKKNGLPRWRIVSVYRAFYIRKYERAQG